MYALLTIYQRKTLPHLHQEWNQVINDGLLQFTLCIIRPVLKSEGQVIDRFGKSKSHRAWHRTTLYQLSTGCLTLLRPDMSL